MNTQNKSSSLPTVEGLRKNGWKCRVHHWRSVKRAVANTEHTRLKITEELMPVQLAKRLSRTSGYNEILPKGGKTEVLITDKDGNNYYAAAHCHSKKDGFSYKDGVKECFKKIIEANENLNFEFCKTN